MGFGGPLSPLNRSILLAALLGSNVVTVHCSSIKFAAHKRDLLLSALDEQTFKYVAPDVREEPQKGPQGGHNTTSSHMKGAQKSAPESQGAQKAMSARHAARSASGKGGWIQLACISICFLLVGFVFGHEAVVASTGHAPYTDKLTVEVGRRGMQLAYLGWWVLLMMDPSILIPTSYELSQEMDCSAAVSGLFVGCGYLTSPLGSIGGAILYNRLSHRICRLVGLVGIFLLMAGNLIMAVTLDSVDSHDRQTMWFLIMVRLVSGIGKLAYVCQFMAYNITPNVDKTTLSVLVAVATNVGLCLGPFLTGVTIHMQGGRDVISSVYSRTSPQVYVMAVLWACLLMTFAFCIPTDLQKFIPDNATPRSGTRGNATPRTALVALTERKAMVAHGILLAIWRSLSSGAIEAGSAMLLETQFHWGSRAIGFSISAVFAATVVICLIIMGMIRHGCMNDETGLVAMAGIACSGTLFLFDCWHNSSGMQILLADVLVYPFMYCASGVADGIVTQNTVPGTWFSLESYLGAKSAMMGLFRFIAFPIARLTIDMGGRNHYAAMLMVLAAAAFTSSWMIASLSWEDTKRLNLARVAG